MAKKKSRLIAATLLAVALAFYLWYTRPMTITDLCPQLDMSQCDEIQIRAELTTEQFTSSDVENSEKYEFTLTPEDPAFSSLLAEFQDRAFRKELSSLLPRGLKVHSPQKGEFEWEIYFVFDETIELPDGSGVSGSLVHCNDFYGEFDLSILDGEWNCSTENQKQWRSDVMEIIKSAANNQE